MPYPYGDVDPVTGRPIVEIDPANGRAIDPPTGRPVIGIDPESGRPILGRRDDMLLE